MSAEGGERQIVVKQGQQEGSGEVSGVVPAGSGESGQFRGAVRKLVGRVGNFLKMFDVGSEKVLSAEEFKKEHDNLVLCGFRRVNCGRGREQVESKAALLWQEGQDIKILKLDDESFVLYVG